MYLPGLRDASIRVVGIVDPMPLQADQVAADFDCPVFQDVGALVRYAAPDFVFAFGAHADMPSLALDLLRRRIPFSIEKPCGVRRSDVAAVRDVAEAMNVFVSVPFHYRLSDLRNALAGCIALPSRDFTHFRFRVNAGSPLRFEQSSPWLIDPARAGGGCMMNLAHHPIDFLLQATGAEVRHVGAALSSKSLGLPVEDHAVLTLTLSDGTTASIETGYTQPQTAAEYMAFDVEIAHRQFSAKREAEAFTITNVETGCTSHRATCWSFKDYFADYVRETVARARNGMPPVAGLRDLERTMDVIMQAYASAGASATR
ncbi:Gfo/Idh/MocA family protein [Pigmentiphaga litoralis]|uniref:Gfo/Idh/MocA family protein n=1 Tax=Pigmentiphaga litoralis TaxID=516702 RepID=UPI003B437E91